jgi:mono/diheme cytochrome c family protein
MNWIRIATILLSAGSLFVANAAAAPPPVDYLKDVKPLLAKNCFQCHGAKVQKGGLRADTVTALLAGGGTGPAIVPGKSAESLLIAAVTGANSATRMPYKKPPLSAEEIAVLKTWIDAGATAAANDAPDDGKQSASHWAFVPPDRPTLPKIGASPSVIHSPIDRFVLAKLEAAGLSLSPEANRLTLIRRVSLDLTGLPPSPQEIDEFLRDTRSDAYDRLVERLLASRHYGERWGRHWLDLARFADSNGYSIDAPREIWKYRDYVIEALNRDLPFNQFTVEQIAGDLLPNATVEQQIATGFHRNTQINEEGGIDREQFRVEAVSDRVATTGAVWLGLTLGCCRCHDHKYDPVTQKEFYQLFAFLNNCDEPTLDVSSPEQIAQRVAIREQIAAVEAELKREEDVVFGEIPQTDRAKLRELFEIHTIQPDSRSARQKQSMNKFLVAQKPNVQSKLDHVAKLKRSEPKPTTTLVLTERPTPRETYVHLGGDFTRSGERVTPGVPAVLHPLESGEKLNRLDFARWLIDPKNPLVARVTVNRIWQFYFGKGIVETENDFGVQGSPPSHPELLDWLAVEFVEGGWSFKRLHKLIVTSATYRQSSRAADSQSIANSIDPTNRLLGRQSRLRLDAEVIRDCALTASGLLNPRIGGPSVRPPQPDGVFNFTQVKRDWHADIGPDRYRRGLYTYFWRAAPHPALLVFDTPDGTSTCTRRQRSNTPLQALTLLNDQAFVELATGFAGRLLREAADVGERLRLAFRLSLGREPETAEADRLMRFYDQQRREYQADPAAAKQFVASLPGEPAVAAAWVAVARVMLNLGEFITRE